MSTFSPDISRRDLLKAGAVISASQLIPLRSVFAEDGVREFELVAQISTTNLAGDFFPETEVWCYNGMSPGPEIRCKQGETIRVKVKNELPVDTTVHWHGLRIPNAMDGVPYLTQDPIEPGKTFTYEFTPPDAGTFWYHSHMNTGEQVGRGLYGALVVDEVAPIAVDRDVTVVLDDWRLNENAQIIDDFKNRRDFARAGRLGNSVTANGSVNNAIAVRKGERVRFRLLNAANARIITSRFQDHKPVVVAFDGQPTEPHQPEGHAIILGPAQRADVIIDMNGTPGESYHVVDGFNPQSPIPILELEYDQEEAKSGVAKGSSLQLPPNPIVKVDLSEPQVEMVVLEGGDLGRMRSANVDGQDKGLSELFLMGKMWAINGVSAFRSTMPPMFKVPLGKTCVLKFSNQTVWPHPMHLHGHHFTVIEHSGSRSQIGRILDTVMLGPEESATVAFVADNPGKWFFHCHILTHAEAGMMAIIEVS